MRAPSSIIESVTIEFNEWVAEWCEREAGELADRLVTERTG